jgi:hypothetical protein
MDFVGCAQRTAKVSFEAKIRLLLGRDGTLRSTFGQRRTHPTRLQLFCCVLHSFRIGSREMFEKGVAFSFERDHNSTRFYSPSTNTAVVNAGTES